MSFDSKEAVNENSISFKDSDIADEFEYRFDPNYNYKHPGVYSPSKGWGQSPAVTKHDSRNNVITP